MRRVHLLASRIADGGRRENTADSGGRKNGDSGLADLVQRLNESRDEDPLK
jgi:hypothetical protein